MKFQCSNWVPWTVTFKKHILPVTNVLLFLRKVHKQPQKRSGVQYPLNLVKTFSPKIKYAPYIHPPWATLLAHAVMDIIFQSICICMFCPLMFSYFQIGSRRTCLKLRIHGPIFLKISVSNSNEIRSFLFKCMKVLHVFQLHIYYTMYI